MTRQDSIYILPVYRIFLICVLTFIINSICAQSDISFARYTIEHGLVNNDVLSICQDKYGCIWFGTKEGCSRFDGNKFKNFQHNKNIPGTIAFGWVNAIISDSKDRLWFAIAGNESSLMTYDYNTEKFIDMMPAIEGQLGIKDKNVNFWNLFADSEGLIWLPHGISYLNTNTNEVKTLAENVVMVCCIEDFKKDIWIATYGNGVYRYNKKTGQLRNYIYDKNNPKSIDNNNCQYIFEDSDHQIWVATTTALNKTTPQTGENLIFERFTHDTDNKYNFASNLIYDIDEDSRKNLLIATVDGLLTRNYVTGNITRLTNIEHDNESLNSNLVRTIFIDKHKNTWIGTNSGVGKVQIKNFISYSHSDYKNSISHNKVDILIESPELKLWIATPKGIDEFTRKTGAFTKLISLSNEPDGLYSAPLTICPDNNGLWIGTWSSGIYYYNRITKHITEHRNPGTAVFASFIDSRHNLWYGVSHQGIYKQNKQSGKIQFFFQDTTNNHSISSNHALAITEDSQGKIWIGTNSGLNMLIDEQKGIFQRYLDSLTINHFIECSDGFIWIATDFGLFKLNKETSETIKYDKNNGLPDDIIVGLVEDDFKKIWVSTSKGLARIDPENIEETPIIKFHKEEGLRVGNFRHRSCVKLHDNSISFGGTEGFCLFDPSIVNVDTIKPAVIITNFKVAGKSIKPGEKINNQIILSRSVTETKKLTISNKNNAFTIEFSGIQYNMPQYISYAYRLDGYDYPESKWNYIYTGEPRVDYMNLPGGNYIFKIKAANSHGIWNDALTTLNIRILPPWWKTLWFSITWILTLITLIFIAVRVRVHNLQKQKIKLERIVEQRTIELQEVNVILEERQEELEQQAAELIQTNTNLEQKTNEVKEMAEQVHEADQKQLRFFANISHEFKTPLALIIAPIEKFLQLKPPVNWNDLNIPGYLQLMHKNSKRLLRLINQLIDFRKLDQDEKKLNLTNNNILDFVDEVVNAFKVRAEAKSVDLQFQINDFMLKKDEQSLVNTNSLPVTNDQQYNNGKTLTEESTTMQQFQQFWFDADVIEKILYNLISNAIKYTPEGGNICVQLSVEHPISNNSSTPQSLIIRVSDTGIGIKPENLDKIFDRFYRVESNESFKNEGSGIGLSYTKELVKLHNGTISVESKKGRGTSFIIQFQSIPVSSKNENGQKNTSEVISKHNKSINLDYIKSMIDEENLEQTNVIKQDNGKYSENNRKNAEIILIVEDNTDLRNFIKGELENKYIVFDAENGKEGLEMIFQESPNLVISDIMMPVMDGVELCKRIKSDENTSHIPVILLTAKSDEESMIEGLGTGADDYITKPFNIEILNIKIDNIFNTHKRLQEKFNKSISIIPSEITHSILDQKFLNKAIEVVNQHMNNAEFDHDAFAASMNYSKSMVYKKIKALTGQSISEFIRNIRLKAAARLFSEGNDNVSDVCYLVGFKHPSILSRYFSKMFQKTPTQFIKERVK